MIRHALTIILAAVALGPAISSAMPITGDLNFSGDFLPTGGTGLGDATALVFPGNDFDVDGATGDFAAAGITAGDIGVINDFQFSPLAPSPVNPLWSIAGFSFRLESITIQLQSNNFLILTGKGTLTAAGFEDTAGLWNLTANTFGAVFNFSSGSTATVPEPGSLALLGAGLLAFAFVSRRRRAAASTRSDLS